MKNKVSISMIVSVFMIFAVVMIFVTYLLTNKITDTSNYFKKYNTIVNNDLSNQLKYQYEIDAKINNILKDGSYTLNKPYILINPYGLNPLSAILIFNTINYESVDVFVNGTLLLSDIKQKSHIVPIVGLYANTNNEVTLKSSSGEESKIIVRTDIFNDYLDEFKVSNLLQNKNNVLFLGNMKDNETELRGFDKDTKLNFYMKFGKISGFFINKEHIFMDYNSNISINNKCKGIKLEIDYLGRIYSINTNTNDIGYNTNININGKSYITIPTNYYIEPNDYYKLDKLVDNNRYNKYESILTETIIEELDKASTYPGKYNISLMGEYLSVDFNENIKLLLVNKYNNYTYSFDINKSDLLKIDVPDEVSLFLIKDNKYYTLLTTLKK